MAKAEFVPSVTCNAEQAVFCRLCLSISRKLCDRCQEGGTYTSSHHIWRNINVLLKVNSPVKLVGFRTAVVGVVVDAEPLEV